MPGEGMAGVPGRKRWKNKVALMQIKKSRPPPEVGMLGLTFCRCVEESRIQWILSDSRDFHSGWAGGRKRPTASEL